MEERVKEVCMACQGSGKCSRCLGAGSISRSMPSPISVISGQVRGSSAGSRTCSKCLGSGTCQACMGTGKPLKADSEKA